MIKVPNNILEYFFIELKKKGKYDTTFIDNGAIIEAKKEQQYYKPSIIVKDLFELEKALFSFVNVLNTFYLHHNNLEKHHDLSYFFNNLLINMTSSDAQDLTSFIYKRISFYQNNQFAIFDEPKLIKEENEVKFYAQRLLESPGLETPYVLLFYMIKDGTLYNLPLIRYAFDESGICYLYAVQFGKNRVMDFSEEYKDIVNSVNSGVNKYRNVSPSFVISLSFFLNLLEEIGTTEIRVPDFLFGRYRKYIGASSIVKSNDILERILNNFIRLLERMQLQNSNFKIDFYPNEIDSYTHISLYPELKRGFTQDDNEKNNYFVL